MSIDARLEIGRTRETGQHTFAAEEIKAFACKFDPQPFHVDEEAARQSVFGALCASGWHTAALWMRANVDMFYAMKKTADQEGREFPSYGPSPGFENLKWPRPVFVGDTIRFFRTPVAHRALKSMPGWRMITNRCEAVNQDGETVMQFDSSALVQIE